MGRKYRVISADGHVETPPLWTKYVPDQWQPRAPRLVPLPDGGEGWLIEGQPLLRNGQNITGRGPIRFDVGSYYRPDGSPNDGAGPPEQRLREQDEDGIDAEVLFPPVFASRFLEGIKDREVYVAMIRAYNTWLAQDYCSVAPDRLIGNSVTPISTLEDAVAALRDAHALGLRSVAFYQFPNGTGFAQPEDDEFWAACLELGMAISPHFGFGEMRAPMAGAGQGTAGQAYASALTQRAGSHSPVYCMAQLMASGVFDRFPEIRFYFAETNASWLPFTLFFMDDNHEIFSTAFGGRKMALTPSEYVAKHCFFSIIRDPLAVQMADLLPTDNLMWGTDFPHSVGSFPDSQQFLESVFAGRDELRRKVLLENPARYFGLDLDADITETPTP
ncbi:MAG: amidohydrolase family protein [Acidimicrobiia bacterium]|jgi:predicted TIM-barrel fold metal-dependent hydrolase